MPCGIFSLGIIAASWLTGRQREAGDSATREADESRSSGGHRCVATDRSPAQDAGDLTSREAAPHPQFSMFGAVTLLYAVWHFLSWDHRCVVADRPPARGVRLGDTRGGSPVSFGPKTLRVWPVSLKGVRRCVVTDREPPARGGRLGDTRGSSPFFFTFVQPLLRRSAFALLASACWLQLASLCFRSP